MGKVLLMSSLSQASKFSPTQEGGQDFPGGLVVKSLLANTGDMDLMPGLGRSLGEGNGNPLQYSCLKKPTDRGVRWATAHGVAKSQMWLSD